MNEAGNVYDVEDVGLLVDGNWINEQTQESTEDGVEQVVAFINLDESYIGKTITKASATLAQQGIPGGVEFCLPFTPTTISKGAIIRLTWDGDTTGHSCDEPTPPSFDFKLSITKPSGKTSPVIQFYTATGTYLGGYGRVNSYTVVELSWQASGVATKITFAENYGGIERVTVKGNNGNNLINNQSLNTGVTTIDLLQNVNTSDYTGGTKTIYVTFS
jgi:hypothetical protein